MRQVTLKAIAFSILILSSAVSIADQRPAFNTLTISLVHDDMAHEANQQAATVSQDRTVRT